MNQKKICLIIPSLNSGGMERVMSELAGYFAQNRKIETYLIILGKAEKFYTLPKHVITFEPNFVFNNKYRIYYIIKTIFFLREKVKEVKPDAILSFGEMYNSFVLLSNLFLNVKVFVSDRSKPDKRWGKLHELLRRKLYPKAHGIISQTSYSKDFLSKETGHKNITIIPNPVKPFHLDKIEKQNVILCVGRLVSTKRIDILLEVFYRTRLEGWELWIVGDGPLKSTLEKLSAEKGLSQYVKFWGNQKDIDQFYAKAKIFAFTSISEGFPNSLLEAMAAGLPCISFNCIAGPSDLITDSVNGFLVPELDIAIYQERLKILINDETIRLKFSANALAASEKYYIEKIGDEYLKFLLS